jgi:hypothetical protein
MGNLAAQMLIRHIESKQSVTPRKVYLDATLVVRRSTAPPAHSPVKLAFSVYGDGQAVPGAAPGFTAGQSQLIPPRERQPQLP